MKSYDDGLTDRYIHIYKRVRSIAPDEASMMLLIPLALFSDCGGNDSCTDFDDRPAINAAQELYTRLLEKYLKTVQGEETGKLIFPRVSGGRYFYNNIYKFCIRHILQIKLRNAVNWMDGRFIDVHKFKNYRLFGLSQNLWNPHVRPSFRSMITLVKLILSTCVPLIF